MSTKSPIHGAPIRIEGDASSDVSLDAATKWLDAITQLTVVDRNLSAPPDDPDPGARYIVNAGPATGLWSGHDDELAWYDLDHGWMFAAPEVGWLAWIEDEAVLVRFDGGSSWVVIGEQAAHQPNSTASTVTELKDDFNTLLGNLRTAGLMASS